MMTALRIVLTLILVGTPMLADTTRVERDPAMNVGDETYAVAFRSAGGLVDAWLTVARSRGERGRRVLARSAGTATGFSVPEILSDAALNADDATYNGVPHFNPCDPNEMVFVSDRATSATGRRSNDIYLARFNGTSWTAERLSISSSAWDDTPVFGPTGRDIYFSSDRLAPGSGRADIFRAVRTADGWAEPTALTGCAESDRHETSPFIADGHLYFSTNASGDQDIWWAPIDVATGRITGSPEPLPIPGVNMKGSNEFHPVISPGGGWLYVSTDRGDDDGRPYRIHRVALTRDARIVTLRVTARTLIRDAQKRRFFGDLDSISSVRTTVRVRDVATGVERTLSTDAEGSVDLIVRAATLGSADANDPATRTFIVSAVPPSAGFVSSVDTLTIATRKPCGMRPEHVIYLDDTTTRKRRCEFTFRTFNVPFFVTTYWCPTTRAYRSYTPCASLFTDDLACDDLKQPEHCTTNEAYAYTFTPAKLTRTARASENCVSYKEFNDSGSVWAELVDRNIEHMRDEVRSALTDPCLQTAVAEGMQVVVTYVGTTDDRAISTKCVYTGAAYADIRQHAPHIEIDSAIVPFIATDRPFNRGGYGGRAGGNQLLSDLRSLYFAILFDNLCTETIPQYRDLKERGLLRVRSRGQAIDQRDLPYALKRAAGVEIRVPGYEQTFTGRATSGGRRVMLCPGDCE
jgi:hypothetical protein